MPDGPALLRFLSEGPTLGIGRELDCALRLDHASVSRRHAELITENGRWRLRDLGSKNGSFAEGMRVEEAELHFPTWLRFGDVACQLQEVTRDEANTSMQRGEFLRQSSLARANSLQECTALPDLLRETLESVCELSGCDRGFLLLGEGSELQVAATRGVASHTLARREFSGSIGAVQRALARRAPVVINETRSDPGLAARPSVLQGGLRCLLCLPLLDGDTLIGTIYADSREPGEALSEFDLELLAAFCERAALWIAARSEIEALSSLGNQQPWKDVLAAHAGAGA